MILDSSYDQRALALEDKLKAILKTEEVQHIAKLVAQLNQGKLKNLDTAINRFNRVLEKEVITCVFIEHAPIEIKEKLMLKEQNDLECLNLPLEFKAFLHQPVASYPSKTALIRDALKNDVLETYTQAQISRLMQVSERAVRYALETQSNTAKQPHATKISDLGQQLIKDHEFKVGLFPSKQAWIRAVLQHDEYKTLRTSELAHIGGVADCNVAAQRTIIEKGLPLPKDKMRKVEPKVETKIETMIVEPKLEPIEEKIMAQIEAPPTIMQVDNKVLVEVVDVVQVKKIVSKTTVESLLESMYPEGIQVSDFHKLLKVVKHLKRAIKSKG